MKGNTGTLVASKTQEGRANEQYRSAILVMCALLARRRSCGIVGIEGQQHPKGDSFHNHRKEVRRC